MASPALISNDELISEPGYNLAMATAVSVGGW